MNYGFVKVAAAVPRVKVADCQYNADQIEEMIHDQDGRMLPFDIHKMDKRAPKFIEVVHKINESGYDVDYISDQFIRDTKCVNGSLQTKGGTKYKAIIIPAVKKMPDDVLAHLISLAEQGAKIIFMIRSVSSQVKKPLSQKESTKSARPSLATAGIISFTIKSTYAVCLPL